MVRYLMTLDLFDSRKEVLNEMYRQKQANRKSSAKNPENDKKSNTF